MDWMGIFQDFISRMFDPVTAAVVVVIVWMAHRASFIGATLVSVCAGAAVAIGMRAWHGDTTIDYGVALSAVAAGLLAVCLLAVINVLRPKPQPVHM